MEGGGGGGGGEARGLPRDLPRKLSLSRLRSGYYPQQICIALANACWGTSSMVRASIFTLVPRSSVKSGELVLRFLVIEFIRTCLHCQSSGRPIPLGTWLLNVHLRMSHLLLANAGKESTAHLYQWAWFLAVLKFGKKRTVRVKK